MTTRDDVFTSLAALEAALSWNKETWPPERWARFAAAILEWLHVQARCRTEEDWRAAQARLAVLCTAYGLRDVIDSPETYVSVTPLPEESLTDPDRGLREWCIDDAPRSWDGLTSRIRQALGPVGKSAPSPLVTFPEARIEGEVFERQAFRLDVLAHAEAVSSSSPELVLSRNGTHPIDLEVVLGLPAAGALEARSPLTHPLRIPEGQTSVRIAFELFAVRAGQHAVSVSFRQSGVSRAELTVPVLVLPADQRPLLAPIPTTAHGALSLQRHDVPRGLILTVEQRGASEGKRFFLLTLTDHETGRRTEGLTEVAEHSEQLVIALCQRFQAELELGDAEARESRLSSIGAELALKLLPRGIRNELSSPRHREGTPLHIESRAAWLPWELFFLRTPEGGRFLGEWFAVSRSHGHAARQLGPAELTAVLVAPRDSGLRVERERRQLERLTGHSVEELFTVRELQQRLRRPHPIGFLHFACHGLTEPPALPPEAAALGRELVLPPTAPAPLLRPPYPRNVLALEAHETFLTGDVPRDPDHPAVALQGACVFLNACHSGLPEYSPWGHESWANTFFEAGAMALIAPAWAVADDRAGRFAQELYERLGRGETFAEAARQARLRIRTPGSPERLAYAVYAFPEARRRGIPPQRRPEEP